MANYLKKRKSPRRSLSRSVGVLHRGSYFVGVSFEVGEGGMMVCTPQDLSVADCVILTFSIVGRPLVSVKAKVCYELAERKMGETRFYGFQFLNLDMSYRKVVRRYVANKTLEEAKIEKDQLKEEKTYTFAADQDTGEIKPTVV